MRPKQIWFVVLSTIAYHIKCEDGQQSRDAEEDGASSHEFTDVELQQAHVEFDENGDRTVSNGELIRFMEKHHKEKSLAEIDARGEIQRMDTSKDGFVSLDEYLKDAVPPVNYGGNLTNARHEQFMAPSGAVYPLGENSLERARAIDEALKADEIEKFKAADMNGDGLLNQSELHALVVPVANEGVIAVVVRHTMRNADTDKNGLLSYDEFQASGLSETGNEEDRHVTENEMRANQVFTRLDKNGDGSLDMDEIRNWESGAIEREDIANSFVNTLDRDGNKHIDSSEFVQGKRSIGDSEIQSYLIAWAKHRQAFGR